MSLLPNLSNLSSLPVRTDAKRKRVEARPMTRAQEAKIIRAFFLDVVVQNIRMQRDRPLDDIDHAVIEMAADAAEAANGLGKLSDIKRLHDGHIVYPHGGKDDWTAAAVIEKMTLEGATFDEYQSFMRYKKPITQAEIRDAIEEFSSFAVKSVFNIIDTDPAEFEEKESDESESDSD